MIPFWKKTGKHSKPQSVQKRRQNAKPAVPRTAQQSIPMQRMFEDGTCRVKANYYTRTIAYQDINYQLAQQEDKTAIFEEWCSFLNFFDSSIKFELSFVNMATDSTEFEKSIRIPFQRDGFDDVRAEYSQMLRQQLAKGNNGLTKSKFITFRKCNCNYCHKSCTSVTSNNTFKFINNSLILYLIRRIMPHKSC